MEERDLFRQLIGHFEKLCELYGSNTTPFLSSASSSSSLSSQQLLFNHSLPRFVPLRFLICSFDRACGEFGVDLVRFVVSANSDLRSSVSGLVDRGVSRNSILRICS
ncbi:hypothetical protein Droror1_Dr00008040 [Drosera rotundifolia]